MVALPAQAAAVATADPSSDPNARTGRRWTLALVAVTTFMLVLDITVVVVALADIGSGLHASLSGLQWVIDAYALTLAAFLLTAATLGDRFGRRRLFLGGTALFSAGSLACGLAPTAVALDVARAVQGIGGAVLFGVGLPLIAAAYPAGRARKSAIGVFGAASGSALAFGPLLGGLITDSLGWRAIFLINVPVGAPVLLAGWRRLPESRSPIQGRVDWAGTTAITAGLFTLVLALVQGNTDGWTSPLVLALFTAAVLTLAAFVLIEARQAAPMLDLSLFRSSTFTANAVVAFTVQATLVAALTYLSLYVQNTLGLSPLAAGLRFLPFTLTSFAVAVAAAPLLARIPIRLLVAGAGAFAAAGLAAMAHLDAASTWTTLVPGFVLGGVGLGLASTVINQVALSAVPLDRAGMASGTVNALKQVGVAAGVAAFGALFAAHATTATVRQLAGSPIAAAGRDHALAAAIAAGGGTRVNTAVPSPLQPLVEHAARVGTTHGLNVILLVAAAAALLAAGIGLLFTREAS